METVVVIDGRVFRKSSFTSTIPSAKCVGVSISHDDVLITNVDQPNAPIVRCTPDEWQAFIQGVKKGASSLA